MYTGFENFLYIKCVKGETDASTIKLQWEQPKMLAVPSVVRLCSKKVPVAFAANTAYQRNVDDFQKQLRDVRLKMRADIVKKTEETESARADLKRKVILEKAMRLRSKKHDSEARHEVLKQASEQNKKRKQERLAKNILHSKERQDIQNARYEAYVDYMKSEPSQWITLDNFDTFINKEFLARPCTTGFVSKDTKFWRFHTHTLSMKKMIDHHLDELDDEDKNCIFDRVMMNDNSTLLDSKVMLVDSIERSIQTGSEREAAIAAINDYVYERTHYFGDEREVERAEPSHVNYPSPMRCRKLIQVDTYTEAQKKMLGDSNITSMDDGLKGSACNGECADCPMNGSFKPSASNPVLGTVLIQPESDGYEDDYSDDLIMNVLNSKVVTEELEVPETHEEYQEFMKKYGKTKTSRKNTRQEKNDKKTAKK